jgi:hypothetical protein
MTGEQAFTFALMVIVLPLFVVVFGTAVLLASPVLILLWVARRLHWHR